METNGQAAVALAGYEVEIRKGRRRYRKETKVSFHERGCRSGLTGEEGEEEAGVASAEEGGWKGRRKEEESVGDGRR